MVSTEINEKQEIMQLWEKHRVGVEKRKMYDSAIRDIEVTHSTIREILGGSTLDIDVTVPSGISIEMDTSQLLKEQETFCNNYGVQYYCNDYGITKDQIFDEYITINGRRHKTGRHFATWARNQGYGVAASDQYSRVCKLLKGTTTVSEKLAITVSTRPVHFFQLGHYGCDSQSCFRFNSGHENNKIQLARACGSFIVIANPYDSQESKTLEKAKWRCFGVYSKEDGVVLIRNLYPRDSLANPTVAVEAVLKTIFKDVKAIKNKIKLESYAFGIYENPLPQLNFKVKV